MTDSTLHEACLRHMPLINGYNHALDTLGVWWQKVTLIGKINSHSIADTLINDMHDTRCRFEELQQKLISNLVKENVRKLELDFNARAQVAIDILIRNLFERTADVGFLATDEDIRRFLEQAEPTEEHRAAIVERLREYTAKYSVYDEIILLSPHGEIMAHLDDNNPVVSSSDPLIQQTLQTREPYVETFRYSDLQPRRRVAHIFSAPITNDSGTNTLGVLCLCFRFDDEMEGIFANLIRPGEEIAILDQRDTIIASSNPKRLALGKRLNPHKNEGVGLLSHEGQYYLSRTNSTKGYQGYMGLAWQGHVMRRLESAFTNTENHDAHSHDQLHQSRIFSNELRQISRTAALVTDDLTLVVLNGQIVSAKRDAAEFMPVLEEIRNIGQRTRDVFDQSITNLYSTVIGALLSDVQFQAFLAVDIMDRNLYERANDVRWWALTSRFREILAKPAMDGGDKETLTEILAYINDLYTVYTNIILFDLQGKILAVSDKQQASLVGQTLPHSDMVRLATSVKDSQQYAVSPFASTPLYSNRHTYVYLSSVRSTDYAGHIVGGIGIVFDSEPQFAAMLEDSLPRDDNGTILEGAFGVFCDREGMVIASSNEEIATGSQLNLQTAFFELSNGERDSAILEYEGRPYAVGAAMSQGYREYKTTGDYDNDVLSLIFVPV